MSEPPSTTEPRTLGGGFRLFPEPPGSGHLWRLEVAFEPPGWTARRQVQPSDPIFPGTALALDGVWLEIVRAEPLVGAPERRRYFLAPWEERFPLRTVVALDVATCRRLAQEHRSRERRGQEATLLAPLAPLLGLLPAAEQHALESRYGLPAVRNTLISTFATLFVSFVGSALAITWLMRAPMGALQPLAKIAGETALIWFWLLPESFVRLYAAGFLGEPMGTLLLALPLRVWDALAAAVRPADAPRTSAPRGDEALLHATDAVRPLPDGTIEIRSRLPKEHWTLHVTGVSWQGELYAFVERGELAESDGPRYRFVLKKAEPDQVFSSYQVYQPEEVRAVYRELCRRRSATWVETFALAWGLLDGTTQERLAESYRYHPWRMTRWALALSGLVGGLLFVGGLVRLEPAPLGGLIELAAGLALLAETLWRWQILRTLGETRPSWLGKLLQPFALRALRWARD